MKWVIDPGALSRPQHAARVRKHLAASAENQVVFTDFALREAFNGANLAGLRRTFDPVQGFAPQIVCLRTTGEIARLSPSSEGLHARFVDELESNRLRTYLHDVFSGAQGIADRVTAASAQAASRIEELMLAVPTVREDMLEQLTGIKKEELQRLRNKGEMSNDIADTVVRAVCRDTGLHFRKLGFEALPGSLDVVYSFQLRFMLANYVLGLFWGIAGGLQQADPKTLRNDVTDTTYVAYATFYHELVTNDNKMYRVYRNTRHLLHTLFGVPTQPTEKVRS
jgi:hypothetical protein